MDTFGVVNWIILIVYMGGMVYLGVYLGKKNTSSDEYFLGGRNIAWWAIGISVMATQASAVSFIGMPGWGYTGGLDRIAYTFAIPISMAVLMITVVPFFYNTKVVSIYEYFERRFGKKSRVISAFMFLVSRGLQTGVVLYAPALALSIITGLSSNMAIALMGIIAIVYTLFGGISAVVYSDVIQMFIIWIGVVLAIIIPVTTVDGGMAQIIQTGINQDFFQSFSFSFDLSESYSFWGGLFGAGFLWLAYIGTDQSQIQRVLTAKSVKEGKISLALGGFIMPIQTFLFLFAGISLYSLYDGRAFGNSDMVILHFITDTLPVGVSGIITAAIFAAGMSSVDSALNSLATVTIRDFYIPYINKDANDKQILDFSRIFTLLWGLFAMGFAFFAGNLGSVLDAINTVGPLFYGAILGSFALAILTKRGNQKGMFAAIISGLAVVGYMAFVTSIGSMWWNFFGATISFAVGYIVSIITTGKKAVVTEPSTEGEEYFGSNLSIPGQLELVVKGKIEEKDSDGYYVIPGKIDKIVIVLIAFFIVQTVGLLILQKLL